MFLEVHLEEQKTELELWTSEANISILSRDSRQLIIANTPAWGGIFKHASCSDSSNGTCIQVEVSDVIWPFKLIKESRFIYDHCELQALESKYFQLKCLQYINELFYV